MGTLAQELLERFESLDLADRREFAAEVLRRSLGEGEISDAAFDELGDALFLAYDEEERAGDQNKKR